MHIVALTDKETLQYTEKAIPDITENEILLKVHAIGVCGSDLRIYKNGDDRVNYPRVIGHEIAGEVVKIGKMVKRFKIGDRVTLGAHIPCGECLFCQKEEGHQCVKGESVGYQIDGGFSEYVVLPRNFVEYGSIQKIKDSTSYELASLSEPFSCVLSGLKEVEINAGDTVVVYGAGAIGCMYIAAAKKMGATKVITIQRSKPRQDKALQVGSDVVIDPNSTNTFEKVMEETNGLGADVVIITAPSASVQKEALEIAKKTGRVLFFAGVKQLNEISLNTNHIIYKQLKIVGTHGAPRRLHVEAVKWIDEGIIDFSFFITHRFSLRETELAFKTALNKDGLKCIVLPHN
ncbi:alcohol dehydrogenase catalytic domain-containing protein [Ornithinibacillus sp. BX22]|uniref:Alcohol dehydrogenase catalytic domain-containing protein n=2 Tax=Ornithinibacillus TaxID=484508 RepID=A0A923RLE4_9BACI|nr:alcohol dehydrogenase catalytic domain-containing protein [Ornithinibacillus hominis]MBS3681919.1 alcohol dehydrogenase catalytic domain-containing protein [Ornithinibacillus massiliensis]